MCERVRVLRARLEGESGRSVGAVEVEKVAYVLAKGQALGKREREEEDKEEAVPVPKRSRKAAVSS